MNVEVNERELIKTGELFLHISAAWMPWALSGVKDDIAHFGSYI